MDSPGDVRSKTTTTATAKATAAAATTVIACIRSPPQSAAAFQDSSIFSYISNLSPIKPVKGTSVAQGFPGLSSPPLVFKSPRLSEHQQSHDLKRPQCHLSFQPESSRQDNTVKDIITGANEKSTSQMSNELNPRGKEHGNTSSAHDKTRISSVCVDDYLADISEIECPDSTHSINSRQLEGPVKVADSMKSKGSIQRHDEKDDKCNVLVALGASPTFLGQLEDDCQGNFSSHAERVQNDDEKGSTSVPSNLCQKVMPDFNFAQHYEQHLSEVDQSQLGKRRRLQFEEAQQKIIANDPGSWNPSTKISRSPTSPTNSEVLESSCADFTSTPSKMQLGGNNISMCPLSSSQSNRNTSLTVSKRSGIGLHLNSIVRARPLACLPNVSIKSTEGSYLSGGSENSISIRSSHPSDDMNYHSSNMSLVENAAAISGDYALGSPASSLSYYKGKSLKIIGHQEAFDHHNMNSEQAERVDEFNRLNPKKKKKKSEGTDDGCKRCNCKKTKCLKLYCDCFAAGIYCAEPCACQGCFNKPEYEDTVLETRQQIEARNPLAFAPKIIHRLSQPPRNHSGEDGDQQTPLAGRHKRGCNCKKSMCLKKYCECYQANVGCSDGCRCEGCQNIYGKKEEYGSSREMGRTETINDNSYDSFDDKLKMSSIMPRFAVPEFHNPHSLTHTPLFQRSEYGKDASKGHPFAGRYVPSPESDCTFYPPANSGRSPGNAADCDMILETSKENFDMVPFDQPSFVDDFSPGCHTSSNTSHLTSVTNVPPPTKDWSNSSRSQFLPGSGNFSSVSSLRWRGSPITPVTLFGETKVTDSKEKAIDIGDDDTPEMLRDSSPQPNTVKVTSPNKKRVSPPKIRLHELGSSSLRSGRKFILRAVPSFPPLTPCIDPKESTLEDTNDPPGGTGG